MDSTCKNGLETVLTLFISISNYYSQKMQIKFSLRSPKKNGQYIPRGRLKFFCFPKRQWGRAYNTHKMCAYIIKLQQIIIFAIVWFAHTAIATSGVTPGTIMIKRGANANSLTSTMDASIFGVDYVEDDASCQFDGIVSFSHPMSLKPSDKFFSTGQLQLRSIEMMTDEINTSPRCGILVGGKRYGIELTTVSSHLIFLNLMHITSYFTYCI